MLIFYEQRSKIMHLADEVKLSLVTAACLLALAIVSKNILNVQLDFISQYGPLWIFIFYIISRSRASVSVLTWSSLIIFVTVAILILNAV